MKKLFILFLFASAFASCTSSNPYTAKAADTVTAIEAEQHAALMVDSAKALLNDANYYVEKGILKTMAPSEVNAKIKPIMAKYEAVYKTLDAQDTMKVYSYRIESVNKLMNLQMKMN